MTTPKLLKTKVFKPSITVIDGEPIESLLDSDQVMTILNIDEVALRSLVFTRQLVKTKVAGKLRFQASIIRDFINNQTRMNDKSAS